MESGENVLDISPNLNTNMEAMQAIFSDCGDFVARTFPVGNDKSLWLGILYIDMLASRQDVEETIMHSLMLRFDTASMLKLPPEELQTAVKDCALTMAEVQETADTDAISLAIMTGDTVLFINDCTKALVVSTKGFPNRGIPTAETEVVVQGSKESFNEVFRMSSALIRRRIRDTNLKLIQLEVGRRSRTNVGVMYLKDVVRPQILEETLFRIKNIDIDAILDSGNIEQFIEDDWISPFPQVQVTERPDRAAAAILEGRIVIIVDNSPFVLIVPVTLNAMLQASEDYYQRWEIMSLIRLLRYGAGFLALALPALYMAMAVYHPSMLPTLLTLKMASARQSVPFPAVVEIVLMDVAFELLREAGIRLPGAIGNTIGIVGGLIIGQAAVEAGLVSPIVVIIVALTGICGFAIPSITFTNASRLLKYVLIFTTAVLGLLGFWLGLLAILIHLVSLKSFGIPYMFPYAAGDLNGYTDFKDSLIRLPLFLMKKRPVFANPSQQTRMNMPKTGNSHKRE